MTPRSFAGLALSGTVAVAGWGAAGLGTFNASHFENTAAPLAGHEPTRLQPAVMTTAISVSEAAARDSNAAVPVFASAGPFVAEAPVEPALTDAGPERSPA